MSISEVLSLLGGIALFLFGISLMGDGLKKISGDRLEPVLYRLSSTPLRGVLLGTGVTAVIQSSSATAVMAVGIVNSGMMKLRQGISVILGAILGTSITGWVISLSYINGPGGVADLLSTATLTCLVATVGIGLRMFSKHQGRVHLGDILMGFAVLMFGLSAMSDAVSGLGEADWFRSVLTSLSNPFLGILAGALFAALLQSASAAVGILQALSVTGAMGFDAALPLLLGISVGASLPVLLAAIGAKPEGRRTALTYPIATGLGVLLCAVAYYLIHALLGISASQRMMTPVSIALMNTLLRLAMLLLLMPFIDWIEKLVRRIVPERAEPEPARSVPQLEERFIRYPALAIEQSARAAGEMAVTAQTALETGLGLLFRYDQAQYDAVQEHEERVDGYEDAIGTYLLQVTRQELTPEQNRAVSKYLHTISDIERISDHAVNLADSAKEIAEKGAQFGEDAAHELDVLCAAVEQVAGMAITAYCEDDLALAARVEPLEELIDDLCDRVKLNYVERLKQGLCTINQSFIFNDILTNCERISDHCSNIAVAMIELRAEAFQTHEYMHSLREKDSPAFRAAYEEFAQRFQL
ncbi:MAG: Na/Pi cotransporter family protein [Oscillospiraceae bacterium]|nr:Na/Pi cotransporter family protein [Oscillospiraceae bacterium]